MTACARPPQPPSATPIPTISPDILLTANLSIASELHVDPGDIHVVSAQRQDWPDSCLGLASPGEVCAQGGIPGWLLIIEVDGARYKVRLNDNGSVARVAGEMPTP